MYYLLDYKLFLFTYFFKTDIIHNELLADFGIIAVIDLYGSVKTHFDYINFLKMNGRSCGMSCWTTDIP